MRRLRENAKDGNKLIVELQEHTREARFQYRHSWRVGDAMLWDNRCTLHCATGFDDSKYVRMMFRTTLEGGHGVDDPHLDGEVGDVLQRTAQYQAEHEDQHARRVVQQGVGHGPEHEEGQTGGEDVDAVTGQRGAAEHVQQEGGEHPAGGEPHHAVIRAHAGPARGSIDPAPAGGRQIQITAR